MTKKETKNKYDKTWCIHCHPDERADAQFFLSVPQWKYHPVRAIYTPHPCNKASLSRRRFCDHLRTFRKRQLEQMCEFDPRQWTISWFLSDNYTEVLRTFWNECLTSKNELSSVFFSTVDTNYTKITLQCYTEHYFNQWYYCNVCLDMAFLSFNTKRNL